MNEFRSIDIDAADLIRSLGHMGELRGRARVAKADTLGHSLPHDAVRALWTANKQFTSDMPSILVGSSSVLANLLPRMLSIPGVAMPVTAHMKAWLIEDFSDGPAREEKPLNSPAALGFVGLIVSELKTTIGPDVDLRLIGMDSVRRTLSYVCAQAVMKGWRRESLAKIMERWLVASALTANEANVSALTPLVEFSGFLQALSELGEVEDASALALAHRVQSWVDAQGGLAQPDLLEGPLSQFVRSLSGVGSRQARYDAIMGAMDQGKVSSETRHPLERGFLISLIEPGSFDFLDLANRIDASGAVAPAYCLCAAILGREGTFGKFSGFGWSVFTHGLQGELEAPVDISLPELRILHNMRRDAPIAFRTRSPLLVDVELAPMVAGSFGNLARRRVSPHRVEEEGEAAKREEFVRERLLTALRALDEAYGVLQGKGPRVDRKLGTPRRQGK